MLEKSRLENFLSNETLSYYERGEEEERLSKDVGQLERTRIQELLNRFLPKPPAVIFDVGGGSGVYAYWLAQQGYEVHLIDAVPLHIEQAQNYSQVQPQYPLASIEIGDARQLARADKSVDVVLLFGPLYHLIERSDRLTALGEAYRILKNDGLVFGVGISRFASTFSGLFKGHLKDPEFVEIVRRGLTEGQHRNSNNNPAYFTTAFFHHPEELKAEIIEAGFYLENILSIQGPGWLLPNFEEHWNNPSRREMLLEAIRWLETEPSLLGMGAHIMAVAKKNE